jgi:hypothetical protein
VSYWDLPKGLLPEFVGVLSVLLDGAEVPELLEVLPLGFFLLSAV